MMDDQKRKIGDSHKEHGGLIPGHGGPAFSLERMAQTQIPVLIAVPHAGRDYPAELLRSMRAPESSCLKLEDRHVDEVGARLARATGASLITAHAPRAMLDLNRACDDIDREMIAGCGPASPRHSQSNRRARSGLGLVPRRLHGIGEIWREKLPVTVLEERIENIHQPYHRALAREIERIRDIWGSALLLDLHSMPPLKQQLGQTQPTRFVIGDRFGASCDGGISARAMSFLDGHGAGAQHNRPYSGGYVLDCHGAPGRNIHALQLEICRSTYLDQSFERPSPRLGGLVKLLTGLVRELGQVTANLGRGSSYSQAAE